MSAPTARRSQWKNPCSIEHSQILDGDVNMQAPPDSVILNRIITLNNRVRPEVDMKMDAFVSTYPRAASGLTGVPGSIGASRRGVLGFHGGKSDVKSLAWAFLAGLRGRRVALPVAQV